jgi:hypothetical protein
MERSSEDRDGPGNWRAGIKGFFAIKELAEPEVAMERI